MILLIAATIGAFFRRWFGGGFVSSPRWLRVCSGFVLAMGVAGIATESIWGLLAGLVAAVTWTLGHGSYMDMGRMDRPDNEFLKSALDLLFGPDTSPSQVRDFTGMALVYSVFTIPAGICLIWHNYDGWFLLPVGVLVAVSYWTTWRFWSKSGPTSLGEYASGALVYGALGLA